ncbi:hypothetical protein KIPB_007947 [Kipferlia bialata]|uniref:Uncharacterized protein n=1 Tax=Kipferlia bialata TaxID=797122 RepID=A0A9K3D158_9EUKA|nr:hypothetical protein KIPB_007947 [Kipferlia bialata]|eukprot:g7947.t1
MYPGVRQVRIPQWLLSHRLSDGMCLTPLTVSDLYTAWSVRVSPDSDCTTTSLNGLPILGTALYPTIHPSLASVHSIVVSGTRTPSLYTVTLAVGVSACLWTESDRALSLCRSSTLLPISDTHISSLDTSTFSGCSRGLSTSITNMDGGIVSASI